MATMSNGVARPLAEKEPNKSLGAVSTQGAFDFQKRLPEWIDIGYRALREQSAISFQSQGEHADACGMMNGDFSLRIRRAPDDKMRTQRAYLEMLMVLATVPGGLEGWCARVLREKGVRLEPERPPSDAETWRALAAEMTDKRKRQLEHERGWPEGWLDR